MIEEHDYEYIEFVHGIQSESSNNYCMERYHGDRLIKGLS